MSDAPPGGSMSETGWAPPSPASPSTSPSPSAGASPGSAAPSLEPSPTARRGADSGVGAVLVEAEGLVAGYDGVAVVRGLDLRVAAGEVVALLGANGAGKTTTLLTVSGLQPHLGGSLTVLGRPVGRRRRARPGTVISLARHGLAHVPEDRGLFFDLTARENIRLGCRRGAPAADVDAVLDLFAPLRAVLDRQAGLLSGGEQQMLALARALVGHPRLLMVDELSLGLAPIIVEQLLPVLRSVAEQTGAGVLVVEQHVAMVLAVADRAYVLDRGRVVLAGPAAELAADPERLRAGYFGRARPPEPRRPSVLPSSGRSRHR